LNLKGWHVISLYHEVSLRVLNRFKLILLL
jgi:hypothetical protein